MHNNIIFHPDEVKQFAALSGDFNPVHVDPVQAREEMFGEPIVHGIFCVMRALDTWVSTKDHLPLATLDVRFLAPVYLDTAYVLKSDSTASHVHLTLLQKNNVVLRIEGHGSLTTPHPVTIPPQDALWDPYAPWSGDIQTASPTGELENQLHRETYEKLFPDLSRHLGLQIAADLLACSRLIGMRMPGEHALFSQLKLEQRPRSNHTTTYERIRWDTRFALIDLEFTGHILTGSLRAFVRPSPVPTPTMQAARKLITPGILAEKHILVLGGSSGLGTATVLLLAAAGAKVTFTFAHREQKAAALLEAVRQAGGEAQCLAFDIEKPDRFVNLATPDWIYYFATPRIFRSRHGLFDQPLFESFLTYYVYAFLRIASAFPKANLFYPSTVAIDDNIRGLTEYTAAKFAGEQVCHEIRRTQPQRKVWVERLPRTQTSQTLAIGAPPAPAALHVMATCLHTQFLGHDKEQQ